MIVHLERADGRQRSVPPLGFAAKMRCVTPGLIALF